MINITENAEEQIMNYFVDKEVKPVRVFQNDNG